MKYIHIMQVIWFAGCIVAWICAYYSAKTNKKINALLKEMQERLEFVRQYQDEWLKVRKNDDNKTM